MCIRDRVLETFARYLGEASIVAFDPDSLLPPPVPDRVPDVLTITKELKRVREQVVSRPKFLIAFDRKRKVARLHLTVGGCFWANSELLDSELHEKVEPHMYSSRCKFCFSDLSKRDTTVESESSDDSESDS